jgi:hypothetical protein
MAARAVTSRDVDLPCRSLCPTRNHALEDWRDERRRAALMEWIGWVESEAGDVITVNSGDMHEGIANRRGAWLADALSGSGTCRLRVGREGRGST